MSFFRRRHPDDLDRVRSEIIRMSRVLSEHEQRTASVETSLESVAQPAPPSPDAELVRRIDALAEQLASLDARITSVARELANQVTELGNDIDALQQRPDAAVDEQVLDELRDSQTRLANEQARYQIAFRSDLARLAEELRRPR